jgi:predicted DNA-binding protein (UPF0251 family)
MTRPKKDRCLKFNPEVLYFKPRGIPLSILEEEELFHDELEALKLKKKNEIDELNDSSEAKIILLNTKNDNSEIEYRKQA